MTARVKLEGNGADMGVYFAPKNIKFLDTGCGLLNLAISSKADGGGWPLGRVVNIIGDKCLSGDTVVSAQRGSKPRKMTMQTLFNRVKGNHANRSDNDTYLVADVGGYAGIAKMQDIVMSGDKTLYEITNDRGDSIKASADHKFSIADGWVCLSDDLTTGVPVKRWRGTWDKIEWERNQKVRDYTYSIPFHPFGQRNVVGGRDYKRLLTARLIIEAAINGLPLQEFIQILRAEPAIAAAMQYTDPSYDVHHLDGDCANDSLDNLQLLEPEEHWATHAGEMVSNVRKLDLSEIVSIKHIGQEPTFDITMEAPHHNFVANNFVVHNSTGKTLLAEEAMANFIQTYPKGKVYYRESEAAFDAEYAQALGLKTDKIDFGMDGEDSYWNTIEEVFDDLEKVLTALEKQKTKIPALYIIDSLDALSSESELGRDIHEGSYNLGKQKMLGELFRNFVRRARTANMCLIFISQVRDRIGVMIKGKKYTRAGGKALDFYASLIILLSEIGKIYRVVDTIRVTTGLRIKAKVEKNKITTAHKECVFTIRFRYGIDDEMSSLDWLKETKKLGKAGYQEYPKDLAAINKRELRKTIENFWLDIDRRSYPEKGKYAT